MHRLDQGLATRSLRRISPRDPAQSNSGARWRESRHHGKGVLAPYLRLQVSDQAYQGEYQSRFLGLYCPFRAQEQIYSQVFCSKF